MNTFHLQVITPDKLVFDGDVMRIVVRTVSGDIGIMKGHSDYVSPVKEGKVKIMDSDGKREAECANGFVYVNGGVTRIIADRFWWI